jgi:hypothetical protein
MAVSAFGIWRKYGDGACAWLYSPGTFVSSDEGELVVKRPVTEHGVQVRVANTRVYVVVDL